VAVYCYSAPDRACFTKVCKYIVCVAYDTSESSHLSDPVPSLRGQFIGHIISLCYKPGSYGKCNLSTKQLPALKSSQLTWAAWIHL